MAGIPIIALHIHLFCQERRWALARRGSDNIEEPDRSVKKNRVLWGGMCRPFLVPPFFIRDCRRSICESAQKFIGILLPRAAFGAGPTLEWTQTYHCRFPQKFAFDIDIEVNRRQ
jgi:hypothetical protein